MKKLLVLVFVASAAMACSKNKPAPTTPPPADQKMEGEATKPEGEMKTEDTKPAEGETPDPCAPPK